MLPVMKLLTRSALAACLALLLPAVVQAEEPRLQPVGEDDLVAHDGDVYIASQPTPEDLDAWAARGITTVVNFRSHAETAALAFDPAAEAAARGLKYSEIPMGGDDGISPDIVDQLAAVLQNADGPVALHCRSGSRAANAYAAYLLKDGEANESDLADFGFPGGLKPETLQALTR